MEIYGDLNFKEVGQLVAAALQEESMAQFPDAVASFAVGAIKQGRLAFFNNRVWIAVILTANGSPVEEIATWVPITNEINAHVHTQPVASTLWTVSHNLIAGTPAVQVYDNTNEMVIPTNIIPIDSNTVSIEFDTPVSGRAIVLKGIFDGNQPQAQLFAFEETISVASNTWVIGHGLGRYPIVRVFLDTNEEIQPASIVHDSLMQVTITFSSAQVGTVRLV